MSRIQLPNLLALAAISLFAAGCEAEPEVEPIADDAVGNATPVVETDDPEERLEEIAENTDDYIGRTVTLDGEIEDVMGPRAFKLGEPGALDSDDITVFAARPVGLIANRLEDTPFMENDRARVTGTIRRVSVAEIERDYGFDLDPSFEVEFEDRVVLIADSVDLTPAADTTGS